jgi:hypothetical protein
MAIRASGAAGQPRDLMQIRQRPEQREKVCQCDTEQTGSQGLY